MNKYRLFIKIGKFVIPISVIFYVLYRARAELSDVSLKKSLQVLHELTPAQFLFFIGCGLLAVSVMSLYDYALAKGLNLYIPKGRVFRIGFIANAFNGILGFGGLAGAGLRTMLYREYTKDTTPLVKGIAWMATAVANGLSLFSILVLVHAFPVGKLIFSKVWILPILIGVACIFPLYIASNYFSWKKKSRPSIPIIETRVGKYRVTTIFSIISIAEWFSAALVLYVLLLQFGIQIPFLVGMGIFTLSAIAGFVSFVPGGFGSFDLAYLLGMSFFGYSEEHVLSALVLYRVVYYFIPFGVSLVLSVFEVGGATLKRIEDKPLIGPAIETTGVIWAVYREFLSKTGKWALAVLVVYAGWVNLVSVWSPPIRSSFFNELLPIGIINLFYNITFVCGLILILSFRGIYQRTKRAYFFVVPTLIVSIVSNLIKALDFEESIICSGVLLILLIVRYQFKRESIVLTFSSYIRSALFVLFCVIVYYIAGLGLTAFYSPYHIRNDHEITGTVLFTIGVMPFILLVGFIIYEKLHHHTIGEEVDEKKFMNFLTTYGGNALSHLAFLGDKRLFFSSNERALIQFRVQGKHVVVLGDPIGEEASFRHVLREFIVTADRFGYLPLFYQIDQKYMHLYHDCGYNFFKLGEEAIVSLEDFTISGKKRAGLRATFNRFEREGYIFEVLQSPFSEKVIEELKIVSDDWLGKKREKGFSVGYFHKDYINRSDVAVLRNADGIIVSFMNLMPMYQKGYLSVDLMRYVQDAPSGIMDVMFIHLFKWGQHQGYTHFNMGMAPLSNVGLEEQSFLSERIGANVFNNIRYMYSFSGLRNFKEKYHPAWTGKYLVFRKNRTLAMSIVTVTKIISKRGKKKTIIGKVIEEIKENRLSSS